MNASKLLLSVFLLLGIGAGIYFGLAGDPADVPMVPAVGGPQDPPVVQPQPEVDPAIATSQDPRTQPSETRVAVKPPSDSNRDAAQGIRGRVTLPGGAAAPDIDVYLLRSSTADALSIYLANRRGQKIEPLGQVRTGADGRFSIGLQKAGETYDLRVVSPNHPEVQHKSVKVRPDDWYDTGDLELPIGSIVQGRVLDETGKFPIAEATVYLTLPGLNHQMLPTPGRERGIVTTTDGSGYFRYPNAPRDGIINLGAEAPDYAYTERPNLQIKPEDQNEFTIELARGQPILGTIVDPTGRPIAGASILATAQ
ncbi:MAG: carboxypeptidase-like regulatory domain-containing protein, partial [Vicinamibacterales bacterium]